MQVYFKCTQCPVAVKYKTQNEINDEIHCDNIYVQYIYLFDNLCCIQGVPKHMYDVTWKTTWEHLTDILEGIKKICVMPIEFH